MAPKAGETNLNQQKRSTADQQAVQSTALGTVLVPYSEDRVSLRFCPHATVTYTVSLQISPLATSGMIVPAGGLPVDVTLGEQGGMVKGPWYLTAGAVPNTFTFLESLNTQT